MFERWEFGMVARKLLPEQQTVDASLYRAIVDDDALDRVLEQVRESGLCSVSLSSTGDDPFSAHITGVSLCWGLRDAVYIPLEPLFGVRLDLARCRTKIADLLHDASVGKLLRNAKQARHALHANGFRIAGVKGDARLIDYVLVPHRRRHGLAELAQRYLGHNMTVPSGQSELRIEDTVRHAVEPAQVVWIIHEKLEKQLTEGTEFIYREVELPIVEVFLEEMERVGIRLDQDKLAEIRTDIQSRLKSVEQRCFDLAGQVFKVGSPKDVSRVLFDDLGLPPGKKTKTGFSTDSTVLEGLTEAHPVAGAILEYRMLSKLISTYLKKLPTYVAKDGRIHTSFNQAVTATGRLSSTSRIYKISQFVHLKVVVFGSALSPKTVMCSFRPTTARWSCAFSLTTANQKRSLRHLRMARTFTAGQPPRCSACPWTMSVSNCARLQKRSTLACFTACPPFVLAATCRFPVRRHSNIWMTILAECPR